MAVTIAIVKRGGSRNMRKVIADVTGPASYTTGGEALTAAQQEQLFPEQGKVGTVDFTKAIKVLTGHILDGTFGIVTGFIDKANNKFVFTKNGSQAGSTDDFHLVTVRVEIEYDGVTG